MHFGRLKDKAAVGRALKEWEENQCEVELRDMVDLHVGVYRTVNGRYGLKRLCSSQLTDAVFGLIVDAYTQPSVKNQAVQFLQA